MARNAFSQGKGNAKYTNMFTRFLDPFIDMNITRSVTRGDLLEFG
jgi:hypothetical protein